MKKIYKMVDYAQPSSPSAKKFGFNTTGCHVVQLMNNSKPPKDIKGFATLEEAVDHADTLENEYHPLFYKCIQWRVKKKEEVK
jgi:hypothetical protein